MTVRELIEKLSKMHQSENVMFNANGEWFNSVDILIDRGDEEEMTDDTVCLFLKDEAEPPTEVEPPTEKVVINTCFGGFGLSYEAVKEIMRRKGMECYAYSKKHNGKPYSSRLSMYRSLGDDYYRYDPDDYDIIYYFSKDLGEHLNEDEMREAFNTDAYFDYSDYCEFWNKRTDPDLVAVVEELGEKANGSVASLCVVEVPNNVDWYIHEYDGSESIEESHRSWY